MKIESEVCTSTFSQFMYFCPLGERQWRYSKHVMEPPVHFAPCPLFDNPYFQDEQVPQEL